MRRTNFKNSICLIIFGWVILFSHPVFSQNGQSGQANINNFHYAMSYASTGKTKNPNNPHSDSLYVRLCHVKLPDVQTIKKLHVKVGTAKDASDVVNFTYNLNGNEALPAGMKLTKQGKNVFIEFFETTETDMFHYEITAEDGSGQLSEKKYWY